MFTFISSIYIIINMLSIVNKDLSVDEWIDSLDSEQTLLLFKRITTSERRMDMQCFGVF